MNLNRSFKTDRFFMVSFPFTRKKLLSLPPARQHKWVVNWLREVYKDLISESISETSLNLVHRNLTQLHSWIGVPLPNPKIPQSRRKWIEFISDSFHDHQKKTGLGLAEADLLPHVLTGDKAIEQPWKAEVPYRVALDNLRSAFNVGSIFRLVDAAGFESLLMTSKTPGLENRQVEKTSMSTTGWIPQEKTDCLASNLQNLKDGGYRIIGIETVAASDHYLNYPWPQCGVVVLGNEEYGISESVLQACDDFVHIPMVGNKNSINVANAFAVIAFHICSLFRVPPVQPKLEISRPD